LGKGVSKRDFGRGNVALDGFVANATFGGDFAVGFEADVNVLQQLAVFRRQAIQRGPHIHAQIRTFDK
jgi:hypothetical protein